MVKKEHSYARLTHFYVRARLAFAIIRATSLCLRGSRVKWRSGLGMDDGAPLYSLFYRWLMHSSICILEEFNFFYLFIYFILLY